MTINWKFVQNTFSYKDFEIISILGSGGFGTCSEATFENIRVCTKQLNRTSKKKAALQSFHAETRKEFFNFDHPNVVRLLAASQPAFYDDESVSELLMVFELIQGRTLQSIIDDQDESIDLARMCRYGHEVSSALDYVHSFNIAHLDVKPANIMVSLDGVCKLADFGCSQCIEAIPNTPTKSLLTGTLAYRAPELLKGGSPSAKCDVYAVGKIRFFCNCYYLTVFGLDLSKVLFIVFKSG